VMEDLDQVVVDLRQVRMVVRVRTAAMGILQADLVGMARAAKGRVEALEIMEGRQMVLGREAVEDRTGTLVPETMQAQTTTLDQEAMGVRTATLDQEIMEAQTATQDREAMAD
jgi:hypothetical protein